MCRPATRPSTFSPYAPAATVPALAPPGARDQRLPNRCGRSVGVTAG